MKPTDSRRAFHLISCAAYTLACLGWTVWAGRDQSWDFLNYHLYVAQAWWENRLPDELFAASTQSYLNPLPHVPFFAAFSSGWHALNVALLIGAFHSTNLWLLHGVTVQLIPPTDRLHRLLIVAGVLLGGLTPAFLLETGTSFADVVISIPSLASLLCVLRWHQASAQSSSPAWTWLWLASLLAGVAMGLKPSALVFSAATAVAAISVTATRYAWGAVWRSAVGGLAGIAMAGGPHALMLWRAFDNPVFPLFNGIFHSQWYLDANAVSDRFRPTTLADGLLYPLHLADPFSRVGFEGIAVDIRPITLIALGVALLMLQAATRQRSDNTRLLGTNCLITVLLATFLPAWLFTSGNTRYAVQGLMLVGPAIALLTIRLTGRRAVWSMLLVSIPLAVQGVAATTLNRARLDARDWSQARMSLDIPEALLKSPAYNLSLQLQSYSALSTFLPVGSRFANLIGQYTLPPDGQAWQAIRKDQQARKLPWRTLASAELLGKEGGISTTTFDTIDSLLSEYDLQVNRADCELIDLDGTGMPTLHWSDPNPAAFSAVRDRRTAVISCAVDQAQPLAADERERRHTVDLRMNEWEQRCPKLFAPKGTYSQQTSPKMRQRFYANSDTWLVETNGRLSAVFIDAGRAITLEDGLGQRAVESCPKPLANESALSR